MWQTDLAPRIAAELVGGLGRRWDHLRAVGRLAETLAPALTPDVVAAAWLHDVGYAPSVAVTGFHPLDGAVFLQRKGAPAEVVGLVAWHTGAAFEAEERGLSAELGSMPTPDADALDALTLVDLVSTPDGHPTTPEARVAEILDRYAPDDPVHQAVLRSRSVLLAAAGRARERLGLADEWPAGVLQSVGEA